MKRPNVFAVKVAGAGALALLLAASSFADSRPQDRTWRDGQGRSESARRDDRNRGERGRDSDRSYQRDGDRSRESYRDNQRVQMNGRVRSFSRHDGGYRLFLDNQPNPFYVPANRWRNDWRVGVQISLGGIFRGGMIYADRYDDRYDDYRGRYDADGYGGDYVSGYVDRVDRRSDTLWLRDSRTGRTVAVDLRAVERRNSRLDARDLRRGDEVTLMGVWRRNDVFAAERIDSIDTRY